VRLEQVSVFQWSYDEGPRVAAPGYALVSAYRGDEGIGYGEGRGTATGRIEGEVVWSNYPRRRSDGRMLPDARGLITTSDGAAILFELHGGRSSKTTGWDDRTWSAGSSRITRATGG
jgi:hypothetical protein